LVIIVLFVRKRVVSRVYISRKGWASVAALDIDSGGGGGGNNYIGIVTRATENVRSLQ